LALHVAGAGVRGVRLFWLEHLNEENLENLGADGRMILKRSIKK
jgi:hypothetical protein